MKKIFGYILITMLTTQLFAQVGTPIQVKTDRDRLRDIMMQHAGLEHFFGIPFAKPPVGNLRWKAPQPMAPWRDVLQTKNSDHNPYRRMCLAT